MTGAVPDGLINAVEDGDDIATIQELRGHRDVSTTMISTHVLSWVGCIAVFGC